MFDTLGSLITTDPEPAFEAVWTNTDKGEARSIWKEAIGLVAKDAYASGKASAEEELTRERDALKIALEGALKTADHYQGEFIRRGKRLSNIRAALDKAMEWAEFTDAQSDELRAMRNRDDELPLTPAPNEDERVGHYVGLVWHPSFCDCSGCRRDKNS